MNEFRKLKIDMLDFRLKEEQGIDPNWFVPHIKDIIQYEPDGCFALFIGDNIAGMATTSCYQTLGWIGWLYVAEKYRHNGFGKLLMLEAIKYIKKKGLKSILLEAVIEAVSLYKRIGFKEQFHTQHYKLSDTNTTEKSIKVQNVTEKNIEDIATFDKLFFHQNRQSLFNIIKDNPTFNGWIAKEQDIIVGYLFTTESSKNLQAGPFVIEFDNPNSIAIFNALAFKAIEASGKPLYIRCPLIDNNRQDILISANAEMVDYHTIRMFMGEPYPLERQGVISLGCPGKG